MVHDISLKVQNRNQSIQVFPYQEKALQQPWQKSRKIKGREQEKKNNPVVAKHGQPHLQHLYSGTFASRPLLCSTKVTYPSVLDFPLQGATRALPLGELLGLSCRTVTSVSRLWPLSRILRENGENVSTEQSAQEPELPGQVPFFQSHCVKCQGPPFFLHSPSLMPSRRGISTFQPYFTLFLYQFPLKHNQGEIATEKVLYK